MFFYSFIIKHFQKYQLELKFISLELRNRIVYSHYIIFVLFLV